MISSPPARLNLIQARFFPKNQQVTQRVSEGFLRRPLYDGERPWTYQELLELKGHLPLLRKKVEQ